MRTSIGRCFWDVLLSTEENCNVQVFARQMGTPKCSSAFLPLCALINIARKAYFTHRAIASQPSILTSDSWWWTCWIKIRWWRFSQGEIACYSLTRTPLIASELNLAVGCTLLSGCRGEIQWLNCLESPICWAAQVSKNLVYVAEILATVMYQQQSWKNDNSFVMRDLLLPFLFVIFACISLTLFVLLLPLNNFYKYFSCAGYWKAD